MKSLINHLALCSFVVFAWPVMLIAAQDQIANEVPISEPEAESESEQTTAPQLSFFELNGYFRLRPQYFANCSLGTYIPPATGDLVGAGTSMCPVPLSYFNEDNTVTDGVAPQKASSLLTFNMRLRLEPTMNVSEDIRIKGLVDVLDNLVLGSTPNSIGTFVGPSASFPSNFLSSSQYQPIFSFNTYQVPIAVKRLWGEVSTPVGELRFGRMPNHFGLGILFNAGNKINDDYGDNMDGISFATRIGDHYLIPAYAIFHNGPVGRGGGLGARGDNGEMFQVGEDGQRFDLDPSDNVNAFFLTLLRKDDEADVKLRLQEGDIVWNYGVMGSYRFQIFDTKFSGLKDNQTVNKTLASQLVRRDAHAGYGSLWSAVYWSTLKVEAEFAGIFGRVGEADGISDPLWILQGGLAIQSRYGLMNDKLEIGFDGGWASGDSAPGFGARPGLKNSPQPGDADGRQYGPGDNWLTNFRFSQSYAIDLILFKEVIGMVTDTFYLKPHVGYLFSNNFGTRGDIIASFAQFASSTPGNSSPLGLEFDLSLFYKTDDGFRISGQYGLLIPFAGLNQSPTLQNTQADNYKAYGTSRIAQTLQVLLGISF